MLLDTLYIGCTIGAYSLIKKQQYPYVGRARTHLTLLVLSRSDLYEAFDYIDELHCALWDAEEFINNNGVPLCDYTLNRSLWKQKMTPLGKFQNAVRRIKLFNSRSKTKSGIRILELLDRIKNQILGGKQTSFKRPSLTYKP